MQSIYAGIWIHLNFQDHGRQEDNQLPQLEESVAEDNRCNPTVLNWDDVVETSRETHLNCKQDIKDIAIISFVSLISFQHDTPGQRKRLLLLVNCLPGIWICHHLQNAFHVCIVNFSFFFSFLFLVFFTNLLKIMLLLFLYSQSRGDGIHKKEWVDNPILQSEDQTHEWTKNATEN